MMPLHRKRLLKLLPSQPVTTDSTGRSVIRNARISGLLMPPEEDAPDWKRKLLAFYSLLMPVFLLGKVSCAVLSIFSNDFEDMMIAQNVSGHMSTGALICLFFIIWRRGFQSLLSSLDKLTERVLASSLGKEQSFQDLYKKDSKLICRINSVLCTSTALLPFIYCSSVPITSYFEGTYGQKLPMPVNCQFEMSIPMAYELFVFLQFAGNASAALQKLGIEFTLFGMLKLLTAYFKYLSESMKEVGREVAFKSGEEIKAKTHRWLNVHQNAIRNVQEFQALFSPVLTLYFLSMVGVVACGIFFQLNAERTNQMQGSSLGMYMVITIVQFYLLCFLADELCEQAENVATEVYCIPWFLLDRKAKGSVLLMIHMGNKPIRIMAYQTPAFVLSKEAFVGFMTSLISAYMGFSKIKELS